MADLTKFGQETLYVLLPDDGLPPFHRQRIERADVFGEGTDVDTFVGHISFFLPEIFFSHLGRVLVGDLLQFVLQPGDFSG